MKNFEMHLSTKLIFGKSKEDQVGEELIKHNAKKVLLHYGMSSIKKSGLYDKVISSLKENNIDYIELSGVQPNPRLSLVKEGIKLCREENVDFILAVGGGSVIDSAKAIALGFYYEGNVWDFFINRTSPKKVLPLGTILTIPAAGSEMSIFTVITNDDNKNKFRKLGYGNNLLQPKFSILNPELTFSLPKNQIAYGICDMYAHILERYFSNTKSVDVTDKMCEGVMKSIINNAKKAIENPTDYDIRAEIMLAGTIAHNNILGIGRQQDWISHAIEHELSAKYDIAHGEGLAIVFPAWMKITSKINPNKFVKYGKEVFNLSGDDEEIIKNSIKETENFFRSINLPLRLNEININPSDEDINSIVNLLFQNKRFLNSNNNIGKFVELNKNDVIEILKKAL
jgi:alcohol dehydrogenase